MATNPYNSQSIASYNTSPPADDGSATEANRTKWSTIKTKLADPLKTLAENINSQVSTAFGKTVNTDTGEQNFLSGSIGFTGSELTISSGVVTQVRGSHTIDTESDAASDDLDTMTPDSSAAEGTIVILRQENSARVVTVKHNTGASDGKFLLANSEDFVMSENAALTVIGRANGSDVEWVELTRSPSAVSVARGYLSGLVLSNDAGDTAHDINITAGIARDAANGLTITLSSEITKQIDANWVAGDDAGGFPSGLSLSADTWYHVFVIRSSAGVVDAGFDTALTASNLLSDSGFASYRRIGAVLTDSSNNILAFTQVGDYVQWTSPVQEFSTTTLSTTQQTATLSIPVGIKMIAHIRYQGLGGEVNYFLIQSPDATDAAPTIATAPGATGRGSGGNFGEMTLLTGTASNVVARANAPNTDLHIATVGYYDRRGRDD